MEEPTTAIVLAGGDTVDPDVVEDLPNDGFIVAADSIKPSVSGWKSTC